MQYFITNNSNSKETYTIDSSFELVNPYEAALEHLGFKLDHKTDDGNVQEYNLLDKETNKPVFGLMEYMYERACFEALSSLGYSCDEEFIDIENTRKIVPMFETANV